MKNKIKLLDGKDYDLDLLLKNAVTDDFYYNVLGKLCLSSSLVGDLLDSPVTYWNNLTAPQEENAAFIVGGAIHTALLEPMKLSQNYGNAGVASRNTNKYRDLLAEELELSKSEGRHAKKFLTNKEWDLMQAIHSKIDKLPEWEERTTFSVPELPAIGEIFGVPFRAKADLKDEVNGKVYDLKTTSDIKKFRDSVYKYNYDSQAFIYCTLFGVKREDFEFIVVDKNTLEVGIFTVSERTFRRGEAKVKRACDIYNSTFSGKTPEEVQEDLEYYVLFDEV